MRKRDCSQKTSCHDYLQFHASYTFCEFHQHKYILCLNSRPILNDKNLFFEQREARTEVINSFETLQS